MIHIFEALNWLNEFDNLSYLNYEAYQLIKTARMFSPSDHRVSRIVERLRNTAHSTGEPLEKAELLLHCASIGHWRGWYPQAARDAIEAVISYDADNHRRAVALWILGIVQWDMLQNHDAYRHWAEAKEILKHRETFFQHLTNEKSWYRNRIWQMEVESAARPEEIWTWLNWFECSCLRPPTQQIIDCVQEKIRQQAYPNVYALMQDLQQANRCCEGVYERAEIYLEFGFAIYQLGNTHFAIELLRKSVLNFYPGIGTYHKQVVARCMLGAVEWMTGSSADQAVADWTRSVEDFEKLRTAASRDNNTTKRDWYTEHRHILHAALQERLNGIKTKPEQNPNPPGRSDPDSNAPEENAPKPPPSTPQLENTDPYRELLIKVRWDRAIADRLIEYERKRAPTADRNELIRRAIERWLHDNR